MIIPNNNTQINNISNEIWHIFESLRGSLPAEYFNVVLFLLSGYKDGLFDNLQTEYKDINNELISCYNGNSKYYSIVDEYTSIIKYIPSEKLNEIIFLFGRINHRELVAFFPEIFDSLLYKLLNVQGKNSGEFIQPFEIGRLIMNLAKLSDDATIYNPFAGLASFATFLNSNQRYYGQEINHKTWALGYLRLLAHDLEYFDYKLEDSLENWNRFSEFDLIVCNPPFNLRINNKQFIRQNFSLESTIIENSLHQLNHRGELICILPQSFLFKRNNRDFEFKKYLIENNLIDTIIGLPTGIFKHTAIGTCIVIINKKKTNKNKIRFIDASGFAHNKSNNRERTLDDLSLLEAIDIKDKKIIKFIDKEDIIENDYNLLVNRYFINDDFKGVQLDDISSFIRGTRSEREKTGKIIKIRNLKDDIVNFNLDINEVEEREISGFPVRKIEQNCLLVALRWKTLKPTYFEYKGQPIYISHDILALKIDKKVVNINYLINELHADYVQDQLNGLRLTAIIPLLRREDFFQIKVKLLSIEEQNKKYLKVADQYLKNIILESREDINNILINVEDENSFLRHQIAGSLKNIRGAFKFIQKIIEEQVKNQVPNLDELKADDRLDTTFANYMSIIDRDLISINKAVNKAGDKIDLLDLNVESFDLLQFLKEYVESLKIRANNLFTVNLDLDESAILEYGILVVQINGDKDTIRKMLDNIIENAEKHAFTNSINNRNKIRIELIYDFEDSTVQINISNTGNPLPTSMTHDSMIRKGSSIGENSGDGIGLWYVNEGMKVHKGKFGYTDETGPEGINGEFVTTMELTFPIIGEI